MLLRRLRHWLVASALQATKIEKVKDNLYIITGASDLAAFSGGNTAVFITDAGVVLVDTKLTGWGPTILERVKTVTNKPVTTIINTHSHNDHSGSNEFFAANVDSVVQENTKANMATSIKPMRSSCNTASRLKTRRC